MTDASAFVLAQITAHPGDAIAAHEVISIDHGLYLGKGRDVPADDNHGVWRDATHYATHLPHLADVDDDRGDADDVIVARGELLLKALSGREIKHRAGRRDVLLDHHDPPGAVEHPK